MTLTILLAVAIAMLALVSSLGISSDYIPAKDTDLDDWALNFGSVITSSPTAYGLISGQASAFVTLQADFETALNVATTPATRTKVTVAAKDSARNSLVQSARSLAKIAQGYPSVTPDLLAAAGLTVRDPIPSPIPAPVTKPVLSLLQSNSLQHVLRYKDSALVAPRGRPAGAVAMLLYVKIGATPPASIADCKYLGNFTRMPATVDYSGADAGDTAYYLAQWVTARGLTGPTSDLFSATIAG